MLCKTGFECIDIWADIIIDEERALNLRGNLTNKYVDFPNNMRIFFFVFFGSGGRLRKKNIFTGNSPSFPKETRFVFSSKFGQ